MNPGRRSRPESWPSLNSSERSPRLTHINQREEETGERMKEWVVLGSGRGECVPLGRFSGMRGQKSQVWPVTKIEFHHPDSLSQRSVLLLWQLIAFKRFFPVWLTNDLCRSPPKIVQLHLVAFACGVFFLHRWMDVSKASTDNDWGWWVWFMSVSNTAQ